MESVKEQVNLRKLLESKYTPKIESVIRALYSFYRVDDFENAVTPEKLQMRLLKILRALYQDAVYEGYKIDAEDGVKSQQREFEAWIENHALQKVKDISDSVKRELRTIFREEIAAGNGWQGFKKRITEILESDKPRNRAERIARTETHSGINYAVNKRGKERGYKYKQWVAVGDERTREAHIIANRQTREIDDPFIVNGERLEYPGDINGSASNIVNCRCALVFLNKLPGDVLPPLENTPNQQHLAAARNRLADKLPEELVVREEDIEHAKLIKAYTAGAVAYTVNAHLRGTKVANATALQAFNIVNDQLGLNIRNVRTLARRMEDAFNTFEIPLAVGAVRRYIEKEVAAEIELMSPNTVFIDRGFTSTAAGDGLRAMQLAGVSQEQLNKFFREVIIILDATVKGVPVNRWKLGGKPLTVFDGQDEVILPPNTAFVLLHKDLTSGRIYLLAKPPVLRKSMLKYFSTPVVENLNAAKFVFGAVG